jgi:hypothetical protein
VHVDVEAEEAVEVVVDALHELEVRELVLDEREHDPVVVRVAVPRQEPQGDTGVPEDRIRVSVAVEHVLEDALVEAVVVVDARRDVLAVEVAGHEVGCERVAVADEVGAR